MFRRTTCCIAGFLGILLALSLFFANQVSARTFTIDSVDISAYIFPDGDLYVEELYTYTFDGSFNGTTRTLGDENYNGLEFFEGYSVPDHAVIGQIEPNDVVPLRVETDGNTFKIHRPAENETAKVFYRYRLDGAARKYNDIGEFYWRFFDEMNETDLHNLRIWVQLVDHPLTESAYGFMHDRTGGTFQMTDQFLYYENKQLPAGERFELRLLFPADYLSEMNVTEQSDKLEEYLQEEQAYEAYVQKINDMAPALTQYNDMLFMILLVFTALAIIYPKRWIRWFTSPVSVGKIEQMDSLTLGLLHRPHLFHIGHLNAMLYRLYQKGVISAKYLPRSDAEQSWDKEPERLYKFYLEQPTMSLTEHEKFFVDWLFTETEEGKQVFSYEQIPVKSKRGGTQQSSAEERRQFKKKFKTWVKLVKRDPDMQQYVKPVILRKLFNYILIPLVVVWINFYLWLSWDVSFVSQLIVGGISLLFVLYFAHVQKQRVVASICCLVLFFALVFVQLDPAFEDDVLAYALLMFIISLLLPASYPTLYGLPYEKGLRRWIKLLQKNRLNHSQQRDQLEKNYQHALTVNQGWPFYLNYKTAFPSEFVQSHPFLIAPRETYRMNNYVFRGYMHPPYPEDPQSSGGSFGGGGGGSGSGGGGGAGAF